MEYLNFIVAGFVKTNGKEVFYTRSLRMNPYKESGNSLYQEGSQKGVIYDLITQLGNTARSVGRLTDVSAHWRTAIPSF